MAEVSEETAVEEVLEVPEVDFARGLCQLGKTADGLRQAYLTLKLERAGIVSLEPLSRYKHLQSLKLANNSITSLQSLSSLPNLTSLDLKHNALTECLVISPPPANLRFADLSFNAIETVGEQLSVYRSLKTLVLEGNRLAAAGGCGSALGLEVLNLRSNQLTSCDGLGGLAKLTSLDLSENSIPSLAPLAPLKRLANLSVAQQKGGALQALDGCEKLEALGELDLSGNGVLLVESLLPLANLTLLRNVNLRNNPCELVLDARLHILHCLSQLTRLSGAAAPAEEKVAANNLHGADADDTATIRSKLFPDGELDDGGMAPPPNSAGLPPAFDGLDGIRPSTAANFAAVDAHVAAVDDAELAAQCVGTDDPVEVIVGALADPFLAEQDIARACYMWVCMHTLRPAHHQDCFDDVSAPLLNAQQGWTSELEAALVNSATGTWADRAAVLLCTLLTAGGLEAHIAQGFYKGTPNFCPGSKLVVPNSAWVSCRAAGKWRLLDPAGCEPSRAAACFFTPPSTYIYQHFPLARRWQLLGPSPGDGPFTSDMFWEMPCCLEEFYQLGLSLPDEKFNVSVIQCTVGEVVTVPVSCPEGVEIVGSLYDASDASSANETGMFQPSTVFSQREGGLCVVRVAIPNAGELYLDIFTVGGDAKTTVLRYKLLAAPSEAAASAETPCFPVQMPPFLSRAARLIAPMTGELVAARAYDFEVACPGATEVLMGAAPLARADGEEDVFKVSLPIPGKEHGDHPPPLTLKANFGKGLEALLIFKVAPAIETAVLGSAEVEELKAPANEDDEQVKRLRAVFESADRNGDGEIDQKELILALRKDAAVGELMNLPTRIRQADGSATTFKEVFEAIDKDQSGTVNWAEFAHHFGF